MNIPKMSPVELSKFKEIIADPVLWAKAFVKIFSPVSKKIEPWTARWYQVEMLRDKTLKKVARCGRRTGKILAHDL
jgi:hypothetical protein